jgi:hypothetical protein
MVIRRPVETLADAIALLGLVWLLPIVMLLVGVPIVAVIRAIAAAIRLLLG